LQSLITAGLHLPSKWKLHGPALDWMPAKYFRNASRDGFEAKLTRLALLAVALAAILCVPPGFASLLIWFGRLRRC
jgi:hypothetical protein